MDEEKMQQLRDNIRSDIEEWWNDYDWDGKFKIYLEGLDNEV